MTADIRPVPRDDEAERATLGAMLLSADACEAVLSMLVPSDFAASRHQPIFEAIRDRHQIGEPVDVLTIRAELLSRGTMKAGDDIYLTKLIEDVPLPEAASTYAATVRDQARRRQLLDVAASIAESAYDRAASVDEAVNFSSKLLGDLTADAPRTKRPRLEVFDVADVAREVDAAGEPKWLIEGKWPEGDYGVSGAEDKAGKTWDRIDLAVSIASGTKYLDRFETMQGHVVLWYGEGNRRNAIRRIRAICEHKGFELEDLGDSIRLCFRVPRLNDAESLREVEEELRDHPVAFSGLDPFYLAAAGGKGSDLYDMGAMLYGIQQIHQDAGAAFSVTTHWTKGGEGGGAKRFVGVGPSAWGRVLSSAEVEQRRTEAGGLTEVLLRWEYIGGEIPDQSFRVRRRVWADDLSDLSSALNYEIEVTEEMDGVGHATAQGMPQRKARPLRALRGSTFEKALTVNDIGDRIAKDGLGSPLKHDTISKGLRELRADGFATCTSDGDGSTGYWWITEKGAEQP